MAKVRNPFDVRKRVETITKEKGISFFDALDIYTRERAQKGIAVFLEYPSQLREQWVGKNNV